MVDNGVDLVSLQMSDQVPLNLVDQIGSLLGKLSLFGDQLLDIIFAKVNLAGACAGDNVDYGFGFGDGHQSDALGKAANSTGAVDDCLADAMKIGCDTHEAFGITQMQVCQRMESWTIDPLSNDGPLDIVARMRWGIRISVVIMLIASIACLSLGPKRHASELAYRDGVVRVSTGDQYRIGSPNGDWQLHALSSHTVLFYNAIHGASMATDAYCGENKTDLAHDVLIQQLLSGVQQQDVIRKENRMIDHRGAKRVVVSGKTDGVAMIYDVVVIKKNACVIDFMLIAPPDHYPKVVDSFEAFFGDFHM